MKFNLNAVKVVNGVNGKAKAKEESSDDSSSEEESEEEEKVSAILSIE